MQVSDHFGTATMPRIAMDPASNAYAVWEDCRDDDSDIYFSYRPSVGSWGATERVNDDLGTSWQYSASIAVDPYGNAYVVWTDNHSGSGNTDVYFAYRAAGGSWSSSVQVNEDVGTFVGGASIGVDSSGNAYAVWADDRNDESDIYFSYRPSGGSWGTNTKVNDDVGTAGQANASIAVDASGNAYAVWADGRDGETAVYFSHRPSGGHWGSNLRVTDGAAVVLGYRMSVGADAAGNAHAVWTDGRNQDLDFWNFDVYSSYRPAGGSWGPDVRVNDDAGVAGQRNATVVVDSHGTAHAIWDDDRSADHADIYYANRTAAGSWSQNLRVNDGSTTTGGWYPDIDVDAAGNAFAIWHSTEYDLLSSFRPAGGPSPAALSYIGPSFLPAGGVILDESDSRITMGDHVHLRLPFKNNGSQTLSNATVAMTGGQYTGSSAGVSIHNGSSWSNQQTVQLTPATIGPGGTGFADFWIFVTDNDPIDRQSLSGQTWLQLRTATGQWTIRIALSPISFGIPGNEELKGGSCLHNPDSFEIQKYAQFAAAAWTMAPTPTNGGDPDTPEQAIRNLVARVSKEFSYRDIWSTRVADTTLLGRRHGDIGVCRDYADLTTGLLRSLGIPSRYTDAVFSTHRAFLPDETVGHAWVEAYIGAAGWRQADSTWNRALDESVYETSGYRVREVWADTHPLCSAARLVGRQYQCIEPCYSASVNCDSCLRESNGLRLPWPSPDLSCVDDVTSRYHAGALGEVELQAAAGLGVEIQAPTFVTVAVSFLADTGLTNGTTGLLSQITGTVSLSDTLDSGIPLFDVSPAYQVATDIDSGETVTVTWTITPLVAGSGMPLRAAAVSGDLFAFDERPLVVNEPGTLPNLTLDAMCDLDTASPGEDVALAAYVLDENLETISDIGTVVTATVCATPTVEFTATVNLTYSEISGMYEEVVSLPDAAPIGTYEVDYVATHPGYDGDSAVAFFSVRAPLTMTLGTNVDALPVHDTLTMTVGIWDRGAAVTEASVWAEITTPRGVITAPLTVGTGDTYTLSFLPFDLRADLGGQVPAGNWAILATADYQGSEASGETAVAVRPSVSVPLALKRY